MNSIVDDLFKLQDLKYRDFQIKLIPNIKSDIIIGVRTPDLRKYAKKIDNYETFLKQLPHKYFDENQLHAYIISNIKSYDECLIYLNEFLPYVDNWATCDQMSPKVFKKNHRDLIKQVKKWLQSKETYTIRFAIGMLLEHYLDDDFKPEYLKIVANIKSNEYYVNMMIAWFFATALAKQYELSIKYLESDYLDPWIHNKIIQKSIESYRISQEKKEYLKSLKKIIK